MNALIPTTICLTTILAIPLFHRKTGTLKTNKSSIAAHDSMATTNSPAFATNKNAQVASCQLTSCNTNIVLVTGYCNCSQCCGWRKKWFFFGDPVYNYGNMKGRPKQIGTTASGATTKHGTIAADPQVFKFGTRLFVPGYGTGTVEDVGGSIKGQHIDVWFPTHEEARQWGARKLPVEELKE